VRNAERLKREAEEKKREAEEKKRMEEELVWRRKKHAAVIKSILRSKGKQLVRLRLSAKSASQPAVFFSHKKPASSTFSQPNQPKRIG
jgi:predicted secreted protein